MSQFTEEDELNHYKEEIYGLAEIFYYMGVMGHPPDSVWDVKEYDNEWFGLPSKNKIAYLDEAQKFYNKFGTEFFKSIPSLETEAQDWFKHHPVQSDKLKTWSQLPPIVKRIYVGSVLGLIGESISPLALKQKQQTIATYFQKMNGRWPLNLQELKNSKFWQNWGIESMKTQTYYADLAKTELKNMPAWLI